MQNTLQQITGDRNAQATEFWPTKNHLYTDRRFFYFVHPVYFSKGRLNRNTSLNNAKHFKITLKLSIITVMKVGFADCISFSYMCLINWRLSVYFRCI